MYPSLTRKCSYPTMEYMARIVKIEYGYEAIFSGFAQETRISGGVGGVVYNRNAELLT